MHLLRRSVGRVVGMSAAIEPDAEQVEMQRARSLLELAGGYVRQALDVPGQLDAIMTVIGEQAVELAHLRQRIETLERRAGGGR
jgi:hypothetical protein